MNESPNHHMLRLARELRGMSQPDLAQQSHISQASISRYESGWSAIPNEDLEILSQTLDFPVSFFFREGKQYGLDSGMVFHRKRQSLSKKQREQIDALLNLSRLNMKLLLDRLDVKQRRTVPNYDVRKFNGSIEDIALAVRGLWRLPSGPIDNLITVLEDAFCLIFPYDFNSDAIDEAVQWIEENPPIMLVNSNAPGDRLRFSIAHALGHLVMHQNTESYPDMEKEAHQFAGAFLMPAQDIETDLNNVSFERLLQLKPKWRVSIASLIYRAHELGKISDRKKTSLFEMLSRSGYRKTEPFPLPTETPTLFKAIWGMYQRELDWNEKELARELSVHERDVLNWYFPEKPPLSIVMKPKLKKSGGNLSIG